MLNIFKKKQNNTNDKSLSINYLNKEKNDQINNKSKRDEYNNIIYYPSSSKEWFSSVYNYNISYSKLLIVYDVILNKLFGTYCNMLQNKIKVLLEIRFLQVFGWFSSRIYKCSSMARVFKEECYLLLVMSFGLCCQ